MTTHMPVLESARLRIRPFEMGDLEDVYRLLDVELREAELGSERMDTLAARETWLRWAVLNYDQLGMLYQPPYGDRAVVLKQTGEMIGSCGYVPCLMPFEQIPCLAPAGTAPGPRPATPEFGLFYAVFPAHQRRGYASEAARAMVDYAFGTLYLKRVVATTTYDNLGSMGVMRHLGMRVEHNSLPEPHYLQVVGVVENPARVSSRPE
jgi:RimJ/RimL family protein N-acetyltransferase